MCQIRALGNSTSGQMILQFPLIDPLNTNTVFSGMYCSPPPLP